MGGVFIRELHRATPHPQKALRRTRRIKGSPTSSSARTTDSRCCWPTTGRRCGEPPRSRSARHTIRLVGGSCATGGESMSQHVIYSYDPAQDAKFAYRSFPQCPAPALQRHPRRGSARPRRRHARFSLDGDPVPDGRWSTSNSGMRWDSATALDRRSRTSAMARMGLTVFLQRPHPRRPPRRIRPTRLGPHDIGEPIVIACSPTRPDASVIDQLTERSVLRLCSRSATQYPRMEAAAGSAASPESAPASESPLQSLSDAACPPLDDGRLMDASGVSARRISLYQRPTTGSTAASSRWSSTQNQHTRLWPSALFVVVPRRLGVGEGPPLVRKRR